MTLDLEEVEKDVTEMERKTRPSNYPSKETIDGWKTRFGDVMEIEYTPGQFYIYRGVTRTENKRLRDLVKKLFERASSQMDMQVPNPNAPVKTGGPPPKRQQEINVPGIVLDENGTPVVDQDWMDEQVVKLGVLYPKVDDEYISKTKVGEIPTLSELIMRISGFAPENAPVKL